MNTDKDRTRVSAHFCLSPIHKTLTYILSLLIFYPHVHLGHEFGLGHAFEHDFGKGKVNLTTGFYGSIGIIRARFSKSFWFVRSELWEFFLTLNRESLLIWVSEIFFGSGPIGGFFWNKLKMSEKDVILIIEFPEETRMFSSRFYLTYY